LCLGAATTVPKPRVRKSSLFQSLNVDVWPTCPIPCGIGIFLLHLIVPTMGRQERIARQ
jgi:hypothetical protein